MRNQKVTSIMRQKYRKLTQDHTTLVVFAVSNSDYIKHSDGYDLSEEIPVSVRTTGIPSSGRVQYSGVQPYSPPRNHQNNASN